MRLPCAARLFALLLVVHAQTTNIGVGQIIPPATTAKLASTNSESPRKAGSVPRRMKLESERGVTYAGMFSADARFHPASRWDRFRAKKSDPARQKSVPPRMLQSSVRVFEDFDAPAHRVAAAETHTLLGSGLDSVVTFVYGGREVLQRPSQVTTDSNRRLIVSDPARHAVDVLDPKRKTSFTILGGDGHRLQLPAGVAVDAQDNIYVADSARGMLLVYDRMGKFLRYIGRFHGENWYEFPTGIAIDRKSGHLFVADSPRNLIFMLDPQGTVLKRMGTDKRVGRIDIELDFPTWISLNDKQLAVLDKGGSRVQILDEDCKLVGSFVVPRAHRLSANEGGITLDQEGNIYLSDVSASAIRVYSPQGRLLFSFGQNGSQFSEFDSPQGLWVDGDNRLFVAEAENDRVQVFQLSAR